MKTETTKYTPAWHLIGSRSSGYTIHATLPNGGDSDSLACCLNKSFDTNEANARLIASAPELVEALKVMLEQFDSEKDAAIAEMFGPCGGSSEIIRNQARAALRKAGAL